MIALLGGTAGPKFVTVRLEPIARIRSARPMKSANILDRERVAAPSASGWLSAIALLPGLVATTGAGDSSAMPRVAPKLRHSVRLDRPTTAAVWLRGASRRLS